MVEIRVKFGETIDNESNVMAGTAAHFNRIAAKEPTFLNVEPNCRARIRSCRVDGREYVFSTDMPEKVFPAEEN